MSLKKMSPNQGATRTYQTPFTEIEIGLEIGPVEKRSNSITDWNEGPMDRGTDGPRDRGIFCISNSQCHKTQKKRVFIKKPRFL